MIVMAREMGVRLESQLQLSNEYGNMRIWCHRQSVRKNDKSVWMVTEIHWGTVKRRSNGPWGDESGELPGIWCTHLTRE